MCFINRDTIQTEQWIWVVVLLVVSRVAIALWSILRQKPFIEISNDWITLKGIKLNRHNIRTGRILSARINGDSGKYLEIAFKNAPAIPLRWRVVKFFTDSGFPVRCSDGLLLAKKPRLIVPMEKTSLTENEIYLALNNSEQECPAQSATVPASNPR